MTRIRDASARAHTQDSLSIFIVDSCRHSRILWVKRFFRFYFAFQFHSSAETALLSLALTLGHRIISIIHLFIFTCVSHMPWQHTATFSRIERSNKKKPVKCEQRTLWSVSNHWLTEGQWFREGFFNHNRVHVFSFKLFILYFYMWVFHTINSV